MTDTYPLAWPDGWQRTAAPADGRYWFKNNRGGGARRPWTFADARDELQRELDRISKGSGVISSNYRLRRDGQPSMSGGRPADEGVAIYFQWKGKAYAMACDRYTRAEENMRSLALALDAMRQLERHGGGAMVERAFAGFVALPRPKTCWEILGLQPYAPAQEVRDAWRKLVAEHHPDLGGAQGRMTEINVARDAALSALAVRNAQ